MLQVNEVKHLGSMPYRFVENEMLRLRFRILSLDKRGTCE
jgi:hypothetical protein